MSTKTKKGECAHCGSKQLNKIDSVFIEDVDHNIYECEKCGKLTISHLFWEKISKTKKDQLKKHAKSN